MKSTTRLVLSVAAVGIAGGLINIGNAYIFAVLSVTAPWLIGVVAGLYWLPGVLAQALFRRGGVALLALLIAGITQAPFVPTGVASITSYLIIGVLLEIPFLVFRYRRWSTWLFSVAAVFGAAVYGAMWVIFYAGAGLVLWQLALLPVVLLAALLAVTWLALFLAGRIARTGVLRGIGPDDARRPVGTS